MAEGKIIYVVSSTGAVGGGMGRVKDYILASGGDAAGRFRFEPLITRDERGAAFSLLLLARAALLIWWGAISGRLAFVHVNFGDKGSAFRKGMVILAAWIGRVPVILHLHAAALIELHAESGELVRSLIRLPFRAATSIIVLGRLWRDWLVNDLGIEAGKIDVLYNGVPVEPVPRRFEAGTDGVRTILFLGLLTERKGISDFLHALAGINPAAPRWRAIVAGNGDIPGYQAKADGLGLTDRIEFTGWVDQQGVRRLLGQTDMMVLPSYHEGLPLVILEALGAGAPVICTPVGAIPEVLEHDRDVVLVQPGDVAGLAAAMSALIAEPHRLQALSDHGIERFREHFSLEVFLRNLFQIYGRRVGADVMLRSGEPDGKAVVHV